MNIDKEEAILLTGAGFTHNFGTPLASGMWAEIFNRTEIQSNLNLRNVMLQNFDYEGIYHDVLNGNFTIEEKEAMSVATYNAYDNIDSIIREYKFTSDSPYPVNIYGVQKFISQFAERGSGFYFTLNQDMFLERNYYNGCRPTIPGIINHSKWFSTNFSNRLGTEDIISLPNKEQLEKIKSTLTNRSSFSYIKLHGSQNWVSSSGDRKMVIGRGKYIQIKGEPLLTWYFEIFRNTLLQPNRKLLVIGYSFSDEHINEIIAEAVLQYKLKLYILSPMNPSTLRDSLLSKCTESNVYGSIIWNGINGYFPYTLQQVYPKDQSITHPCRLIYNCLFNCSPK